METIQEIQEFNRKKIICAVHNTINYKEALDEELGYGCEVKARVWAGAGISIIIDNLTCYNDGQYLRFRELVGDVSKKDLTDEGLERLKEYEGARHRIIKIIGKPITFDRVLLALKKIKEQELKYYEEFSFCITGEGKYGDVICKGFNGDYESSRDNICEWDLTKQTLEEQKEETQRAIYKLLNEINHLKTKE